MSVQQEYHQKLITAKAGAELVKSGDHVFYGEFALFPVTMDAALALRVEELKDVHITGTTFSRTPKVTEADPEREHFIVNDWHFSALSRALHRKNLCNYIPFTYHQGPRVIRKYLNYDVIFLTVTPMDDRGYFNFGLSNSLTPAVISKAKKIVVEVNSNVPRCLGGNQESVHISRIDYVVEGNNHPLFELSATKASEVEAEIAKHIMGEIQDGCCLQLGIGGLPNVIGTMIAESDLQDLGIHTEMLVDSMVDLYNSKKVTGRRKAMDTFKMAYTFAMGTKKLYDFLNNNPTCASYPVNYINDPRIIALNNNMIAINNAIEIDLFSQVCSESVGPSQISGTGGQLDFIFGPFMSHKGKGIMGLSSTVKDKDGNLQSRIVPTLRPGSIVTVPRSIVQYVATEYGIVQLKGKSTWERAEALIGIAHPQFRDELIKEAQKMNIWSMSNK
jgi:butyryl-CoA:acetate CoA-transferase